MIASKLFCDSARIWHSGNELEIALKSVGAEECDALFVHSDIAFGLPNREIKRKEYLDIFLQIILGTGVKTVIFPTFTYSFCNGEDYDVLNSVTSMGALNEHARKQAGANRSLDPLLAVSALGQEAEKFISYECDDSLGRNSIFDIIHHTDNVKFLCFGAEFSNCFTYVHYVEKMLDVPYRFDMPFEGNIIDAYGKVRKKTQNIHTACEGIRPVEFYHFKDLLIEKNCMKRVPVGNREICCIDEPNAYYWIKKKINERVDYFLEQAFTDADLGRKYTFDKANGRITHC